LRFSLSWLADYLDLGEGLGLEADSSGRHAMRRVGDEENRKAVQIGERLTSIGLAVEGYPIHRAGGGEDAEAGPAELGLEVEVTSNRPDCMCHLGLARELAVALEVPLRIPPTPLYGSLSSDGSSGAVGLEDPEGCPRYVARIIRGLKVGPSPAWLRRRLESIGQRSINNVVDVTNFVLWETGQPLHAFDLATLPGGEVRVRRARAGERLVTLDGRPRELDPEVLVIADRERAMAIAGVMGGLATEVTAATTDVLLESAFFDRRRVRIGAKRLGLHTDASHRFERGADFGVCDDASRRCAALLVEVAGGTVEEPALDAIARRPRPVTWRLVGSELARFAGAGVSGPEIERVMTGLGFAPRPDGEGAWTGAVPTWRSADFEPRRTPAGAARAPDSPGEAYAQDLFEEVLRHVGFRHIPATLPALGGTDAGSNPAHRLAARARRTMASLGFAEGIHYAFHERAADAALPVLVLAGAPLALANPLSDRYAVLRRSLVPNLVAAAEFNARRGAAGVRLFEVGRLFPGGGAEEVDALAAVAGGADREPWDRPAPYDLLDLKGAFEALLAALPAGPLEARAAELPGIVPGTGAQWLAPGHLVVGWFGRVERADLSFELHAGELLLSRLAPEARPRRVAAPSRLPSVLADLTLTHSLGLSWSELAAAIAAAPVEHLADFRIKDRYQGEGVPPGAVATTITFEYNAGERSLTQEEVNERQGRLAAELERRFGLAREEPR
jgi:phenylalanyl-tRNA synthetase beta chain